MYAIKNSLLDELNLINDDDAWNHLINAMTHLTSVESKCLDALKIGNV
jgi:hypothetical protein